MSTQGPRGLLADIDSRSRVVISIGGNALIRRTGTGEIAEQFRNTEAACRAVTALLRTGCRIIITHGNGPVVGNIVLRNEAARNIVPPMPLYICDADSEGGLGFMIQQTLYNMLHRAGRDTGEVRDVATIVTQVVVDPGDRAFRKPTKPIGPYYNAEEAEAIRREKAWVLVEDSGRGFRRVVPSPMPVRIVEARVIRTLSEGGVVVIAAGGGGVPVAERPDGTLYGVEAVVDKDLATSLLARETGAEIFINLTQVEMVYEDYGTPGQKGLPVLSVEEAERHLEAGEFAPGSMAPKIESAIEFLTHGGRTVLITSPEKIDEALAGKAGTIITG